MAAADFVSKELGEYAEILTDSNLAQFLATEGWMIQQDSPWEQVWAHADYNRSGAPRYLHLPRDARLDDYHRRLEQAVQTMSQIYDWTIPAVAERVSSIRADLFFVRVDQSSKDGTIPLRQASDLLENIDAMIRSAALTAHSPTATGRGRMPDYVRDFLADDVRMGHTKRGSFIITVAARLDSDAVVTPAEADQAAPPQETGEPDRVMSYTRHVMTTLSRSIQATQDYLRASGSDDQLDAALEKGMRLPLIKALRSVGDAEGVRGLNLNFEWSVMEPIKVEVPDRFALGRKTLESLVAVEERLSARIDKPRDETIIGPVVELKRTEEPGATDEDEGEVVIRAEVDGKSRRITVPLRGDDYDWAIQAHRQHLPFTVSGTLEKVGRSWRLGGVIRPDTQFLEFARGNASRGAGLQRPAPPELVTERLSIDVRPSELGSAANEEDD